jgi:hypothetical protein
VSYMSDSFCTHVAYTPLSAVGPREAPTQAVAVGQPHERLIARGRHDAQELRELRLGEPRHGVGIPGVRHGAGHDAGGKMRVSALSGDSWGNT